MAEHASDAYASQYIVNIYWLAQALCKHLFLAGKLPNTMNAQDTQL